MNKLNLYILLGLQTFCFVNAQEKSPTELLLGALRYGDMAYNATKKAIAKGADVNFRIGAGYTKINSTSGPKQVYDKGISPIEILISSSETYPIEQSLRLLLTSGADFRFIYETEDQDLINYVEKIYLEELDKMVQNHLPISNLVKMVREYNI